MVVVLGLKAPFGGVEEVVLLDNKLLGDDNRVLPIKGGSGGL